jgi:hypothetical protein
MCGTRKPLLPRRVGLTWAALSALFVLVANAAEILTSAR